MDFYVQMLTTVITAALGWLAVHWLTMRRDRRNRLANLRVEYLVESYRNMQSVLSRPIDSQESLDKLQSAINDLYLLGSAEDVKVAAKLMSMLQGTHEGEISIEGLMKQLRNSIREEIGQVPLDSSPVTLRLEYKQKSKPLWPV